MVEMIVGIQQPVYLLAGDERFDKFLQIARAAARIDDDRFIVTLDHVAIISIT